MGKPILRAVPMWLAALVGEVIGGFLDTAAIAVVFVLPVKLSLDPLVHFAEHGMLGFASLRLCVIRVVDARVGTFAAR